jgi:hypothetical protein
MQQIRDGGGRRRIPACGRKISDPQAVAKSQQKQQRALKGGGNGGNAGKSAGNHDLQPLSSEPPSS